MTLTIREPGSALTHFFTMMAAFPAATILLVKASASSRTSLLAMSVFMLSIVLLYGASALYHTLTVSAGILRIFQKIDHMMIFVLIAGSYTPICMIVLGGKNGYQLLGIIWGLAALGMLTNILWINCPKWFSSLIYIAMGWACVAVFGQLVSSMQSGAFTLLLSGGIIYTVGGIIYALKLPVFNSRHADFGSHEIFHLFVMAGSICHFLCMYIYIA